MSAIVFREESAFKDYEFVRRLGQGHFGSVFEARNLDMLTGNTNGKRAVKFEAQNANGDGEMTIDIMQKYVIVLNEFNALLTHSPFIVKTLDFYTIKIGYDLQKLSQQKFLRANYNDIYIGAFRYILSVLSPESDYEVEIEKSRISPELLDFAEYDENNPYPMLISVTELEIAGGTLTKLLEDCLIKPEDRVSVMFQLMWNQYAMQRSGINHNDVKPDNILYETRQSMKGMLFKTASYDTKQPEYFKLRPGAHLLKLADFNVSNVEKDEEFKHLQRPAHAGTPLFTPINDIILDKTGLQWTYKDFYADPDLFGLGLIVFLVALNGMKLENNNMKKRVFDFVSIDRMFDVERVHKLYMESKELAGSQRISRDRAPNLTMYIVALLSLQHYIGNGFLPDTYPERRGKWYPFYAKRKEEILDIGRGFFDERPDVNIFEFAVKQLDPHVRELIKQLIQWDSAKKRKFPDGSSELERGAFVHDLLSHSPVFEDMRLGSDLPDDLSDMEIYGFDTPEEITFFPTKNKTSMEVKMRLGKSISDVLGSNYRETARILEQSKDVFNEREIYVMKNVRDNTILLSFDKKHNICAHKQQESRFLSNFHSLGKLCSECNEQDYHSKYRISKKTIDYKAKTAMGVKIDTKMTRKLRSWDPDIPLSQILAKFKTKDKDVRLGSYLISVLCMAGFGDYALAKSIARILVSKGCVNPKNILIYYHLDNLQEELDFSDPSDVRILKSKYDFILETLAVTGIPLENISIGSKVKGSVPNVQQRGVVWKTYEENYAKYIDDLRVYTNDHDKMSIQLINYSKRLYDKILANISILEGAITTAHSNFGNDIVTDFGLFNSSLGVPFNLDGLLPKHETDKLISRVDPDGLAPLKKTFFYYPSFGNHETQELAQILNIAEPGPKTIITPRLIGERKKENTVLSLFHVTKEYAFSRDFDHRLDVLRNQNDKGVVLMSSRSLITGVVYKLYIVCVGNLTNLEFKSIMANTTETIAYVGADGSMADALSVGKYPCLEKGMTTSVGRGLIHYATSIDERYEDLKYLTYAMCDNDQEIICPKALNYDEKQFRDINMNHRDRLKMLAERFVKQVLPKIKTDMNMNKNLLRLLNRQFKVKKGEINEKYDNNNVLLSV